jgi:outer membrane protein OmpA-like peptidoglycan-associated protein
VIRIFIAFSLLFLHFGLTAQFRYSGKWQGIIVKNGADWQEGNPIYFDFEIINNLLDGKCRMENYSKEQFRIYKLGGKLDSNRYLNVVQKSIIKESYKSPVPCLLNFNLTYNFTTGYLEGTYEPKCPSEKGKIILYKSKFDFNEKPEPLQDHSWFDRFVNDLKEGLSSPEQRLVELRNFKFDPIYFDYDKYEIKNEYQDYLRKMIKMVKSHSDLRIKITGHTDADGSYKYNEKLSQNRAKALIRFFEDNGLEKSRVVIDFRGEKQPVDSNKTPEGKQRNRRVDFTFI